MGPYLIGTDFITVLTKLRLGALHNQLCGTCVALHCTPSLLQASPCSPRDPLHFPSFQVLQSRKHPLPVRPGPPTEMAATATETESHITLKGSVETVAEFFDYSINSILYQRGIYDPDKFMRKQQCVILLLGRRQRRHPPTLPSRTPSPALSPACHAIALFPHLSFTYHLPCPVLCCTNQGTGCR